MGIVGWRCKSYGFGHMKFQGWLHLLLLPYLVVVVVVVYRHC